MSDNARQRQKKRGRPVAQLLASIPTMATPAATDPDAELTVTFKMSGAVKGDLVAPAGCTVQELKTLVADRMGGGGLVLKVGAGYRLD